MKTLPSFFFSLSLPSHSLTLTLFPTASFTQFTLQAQLANMQFSLLAAFLLATTPALGFKPIPEGTPDGVYSVSRDAAGNEVHTREGDVAFRAAALPRAIRGGSLLKRDGIDEFGCFKAQQELGHGDCDNAVRALRAQIPDSGRTVGSHLGLYSISGDVVSISLLL